MVDKPKLIKKVLNAVLSAKGIGSLIFFVTLLILTVLLSSRYYLFENVIENGVSKKDIYATKTIRVIDTEKTERRKLELANKVEPILMPIQSENVDKNLIDLLSSIKSIRNLKESSLRKEDDLRSLLDITDRDYMTDNAVSYLVKCSDNSFNRLSKGMAQTVNSVLSKGISEKDLSDDNGIIAKSVNTSFPKTQRKAIALLTSKILASSMTIDELATDIARKNVMNSVKTVEITFHQGEKIVSADQAVTKLERAALKKAGYNVSEPNLTGMLGILCLIGICLFTIAYYLVYFDPKHLTPSYLSLISLLAISVVITAILLPASWPVYLIPIPAVAILLTIFTNSRLSSLVTVLIIIMIGVSFQYRVEAMAVFIVSVMMATFTASLINYTRRMDLVKTGFDVSIVQILIILSTYLIQNNTGDAGFETLFIDALAGFISGIVSGVIALGTIPLIESTFKIITPYGLAELADHNQILLRRLQFEAPGTYHHSLMVSNLAEAAAESIGANPILVRVGAFYHDIGKLKRPLFFVENQSYFGIENPHEKLNPRLSKMVVTAHPKDGLELAREYHLPSVVNQFIIQHHGDGLAAYFYQQAIEENGIENVSEEQFRYTGPKPSTKEAAILMLADATESAVRSLKNPSPQEIDEIIDKIIRDRLNDGQLTESPLTLKDIKTIAATFNRILRGMQHHRIKYHENVLEELEKKTSQKIQMPYPIKTPEKNGKESLDEAKKMLESVDLPKENLAGQEPPQQENPSENQS